MLRRLPPLNGLKAFEAAARSESFTRAAEELNVTQGAVSHQVKALEATLGVKLFNRERQRLVITEAGREYLAVVRDALDRIAVGTERLVQRQSSGVLTVSTSPDFAAKWLVNRLGRFAAPRFGRLLFSTTKSCSRKLSSQRLAMQFIRLKAACVVGYFVCAIWPIPTIFHLPKISLPTCLGSDGQPYPALRHRC
jgi:DNA-binding transcriptional LysR family regulator